MPIFGKKATPVETATAPVPSRMLSREQVRNALDYEIARSLRYQRPLSVLRIAPQALPSESLKPAEIQRVSEVAAALLRDVDHFGPFDEYSMLAVLPETDKGASRIVAGRLASELTMRSGAFIQRNWLVGSASLMDDAETADGLLVAALTNALGRGGGG
jgi:hypothetical protein